MENYVFKSDRLFGNFYWPSIARLSNGRLATVASGFRLGHVCPFGKVVVSYSDDEGETWTPPMVILDTPLDDRDAGICVKGDIIIVTSFNNTRALQRRFDSWRTAEQNKMVEAWANILTDEEEEEYLGATYIVSRDGGKTFGEIRHSYGSAPHGPTLLNDGTFFYFGKKFEMDDAETGLGKENVLCVVRSVDGENFSAPQIVNAPQEIKEGVALCEPHAIQLKSGKILVQIRAQNNKGMFTIVQTESDDNGYTFKNWRNFGFHGSPPHLMQHSSGAVIMSYGYRQSPFGVRAKISYDDGKTWGEEIILCDDSPTYDVGYPCTVETKDGGLLTVFYKKSVGDKNTSIVYKKWRFEEK